MSTFNCGIFFHTSGNSSAHNGGKEKKVANLHVNPIRVFRYILNTCIGRGGGGGGG